MTDPKKDKEDAKQAPGSLGLGDVKDLGEALNKVGVAQQVVGVVEIAVGIVFIMIPGIGTLVGLSVIAMGILGVFAKTDDMQAKVDRLLRDFTDLLNEVAAEDSIITMQHVQDLVREARVQLSTLREFPNDARLKDPNGFVLNVSAQSVSKLQGSGNWLRPLVRTALYSDPWSGVVTPPLTPLPSGASAVFDYRLALPAYLEAISIRLTILAALVPGFQTGPGFKKELSDMGDRLEEVYSTIRDGIIDIRTPTTREILSTRVFDQNNIFIRTELSDWEKAGRLYGAVEMYSAIAVVDHYRPERFLPDSGDAFFVKFEFSAPSDDPHPPPAPVERVPSQEALAPFNSVHAIGTLARRKAIFRLLRLGNVRDEVNLLKHLVGEPPLRADADDSWSLRETHDLLGHMFEDPTESAQFVRVRARDTITRLGRIGDAVFAGAAPVSWRVALDAATL